MKRLVTIIPVVTALVVLTVDLNCSRVSKQAHGPLDSSVVLRVADNELTLGEVDDYFHRAYYDDVQTEFRNKENYVNQMLEFYMLAEAAMDAGLKSEVDSSLIYESLLRELHDIEITDKIHFTDDDVEDYFDKYGGEMEAGHILVADSALAESLYTVLQNGGDFDELAKEFSIDQTSKDRGGSLGYMELNYYDVEFMKVAAGLKPGEISRPLQTVRGWHIIKLYDRRKDTPDRLESRFRKYKNKTYNLFERKRLQEFMDEIKAAHHYEIVQEAMNLMIRKADSVRATGEMPPNLPLSSYLKSDLFTDAQKEMYLVKVDGQGYTVGQYADYVEETSPNRTPDLSNKIVMEGFFQKAVLTPLLVREALERGIDTLETFKKRLKVAGLSKLVDEYKTGLLSNPAEITDDEIESYYNDHKSEYYSSDNMRVYALGVKDKKLADDLVKRINDGAVFEELARMYSVDKKTAADGGDLGYFARDRYPELFAAADGLQEGELGKPVKMFGSWWVFRLIDRRRPELRSLDRVRSGIISDIRKQKQQAVIDSVVNVQKKKTDYSIDLNPLREELGLAREKDSGEVGEQEGSL